MAAEKLWFGGREVVENENDREDRTREKEQDEEHNEDMRAALAWKSSFYGTDGLLTKEEVQEVERQASIKLPARTEGKDADGDDSDEDHLDAYEKARQESESYHSELRKRGSQRARDASGWFSRTAEEEGGESDDDEEGEESDKWAGNRRTMSQKYEAAMEAAQTRHKIIKRASKRRMQKK